MNFESLLHCHKYLPLSTVVFHSFVRFVNIFVFCMSLVLLLGLARPFCTFFGFACSEYSYMIMLRDLLAIWNCFLLIKKHLFHFLGFPF